MTVGAKEELERSGESPLTYLTRHLQLDRGELSAEDHRAYRDALVTGARIFSSFKLKTGVVIWVITNGDDDAGRRDSTTLLLPDEY